MPMDNGKYFGQKQRSGDSYFLKGVLNSATTVSDPILCGKTSGTQQINIIAKTQAVIETAKTVTYSITTCDTATGSFVEVASYEVTAGTYEVDHEYASFMVNGEGDKLYFKVTSTPLDGTTADYTGTTDAFTRLI